jgi:hypothetical protein
MYAKRKKKKEEFKRFPFGIVIKEWTQKKVDQQLYFSTNNKVLRTLSAFCPFCDFFTQLLNSNMNFH